MIISASTSLRMGSAWDAKQGTNMVARVSACLKRMTLIANNSSTINANNALTGTTSIAHGSAPTYPTYAGTTTQTTGTVHHATQVMHWKKVPASGRANE